MSQDLTNFQRDYKQFNTVLKAFTVADIVRPVVTVDPDEKTADECFNLVSELVEYMLVASNNKIYGYLDPYDNDIDTFCRMHDIDINDLLLHDSKLAYKDLALPINHNMLVPHSMPILKLLNYEGLEKGCFVQGEESIIGIVSFTDLDKIPAKLCLFTILLEIEAKMAYILERAANLDAYIIMLPPSFFKKAKAMLGDGYDEDRKDPLLLLKVTNLKQKYLMIKEHYLKSKTEGIDTEQIFRSLDSIFNIMVKLRNHIAHGESILGLVSTLTEYRMIVDHFIWIKDILFSEEIVNKMVSSKR